MVAALLIVTGARVGSNAAFGHLGALRPTLWRVFALQVVLPLVALAALAGSGLLDIPFALAVALMLSAPSVTGAPNFAAMVGLDPAPGMRILVLGTALFPLTALPVFLLLDPVGGDTFGALSLSLNLLVAILLSVGLGFAIRWFRPTLGERQAQGALDGLAALLLAVVVVGLMSAIGPLARTDPATLGAWLLAALGINFGLVLATLFLCLRFGIAEPAATAVYAGNRNIALFLIVLPADVAAPLMIFIGCYQVPMYLTPILLGRLRPLMP
ncbi:MAG: hypothetical protein AAGK37_00940 [Pseudomonadota bacterium]